MIEWKGQPVVLAGEVGEALGYKARGLSDLLSGEWKEEFIEGVDFELLKNGRLAEFKTALIGDSSGLARRVSRAPSLILLTEQGLHMVLVKTDKPAGRAMRRWVVDELIPSWRARHLPPPPDAPPPAAPGQARPPAPELAAPVHGRRGSRPPPPPLGTPTEVMLHALRDLHRAKQLPDACYHALKIVVEMLDRKPAVPPPPHPGEARSSPSAPRQLTGPTEGDCDARARKIAAAMRATNPQGPRGSGVWFDAVASNLYYSAVHQADFAAGKMNVRSYASLILQIVSAWAEWRLVTGDIELLELVADVRQAVERTCGPVPGLA